MICSSVNLLARAGVESVPLVVQEVAHPAVELPDILGDLPRDYVFAADDPPTVGDFLEEALTCILTLPATMSVLQLGTTFAQSSAVFPSDV